MTPEIRLLRRLLYCGEWIQSHALHVHLLHAPDFLGFESGLAMAATHPQLVENGLRLKRWETGCWKWSADGLCTRST